MLTEQQLTLELLFEQLGLPSDEASINQFTHTHQLPSEVALPDAEFWSEGQSAFREHWHQDDEWIVIIDKLNQLLHVESDKQST